MEREKERKKKQKITKKNQKNLQYGDTKPTKNQQYSNKYPIEMEITKGTNPNSDGGLHGFKKKIAINKVLEKT